MNTVTVNHVTSNHSLMIVTSEYRLHIAVDERCKKIRNLDLKDLTFAVILTCQDLRVIGLYLLDLNARYDCRFAHHDHMPFLTYKWFCI